MPEDTLYTPEEIAKKLKLSTYTIYEMVKRGDLHAYHIGRRIRISESQFKLFITKTKDTGNFYESGISSESKK